VTDSTIHKLGGAALVGGGVATAAFWFLAASVGTFVGAAAARHPAWIPSQLLHVIGALLSLFGLIGVFMAHRERMGVIGLVGFVLAVTGSVLFAADGIIALAIFPALAAAAPEMLTATGAMNRGAVLLMFILFAAVNMIGLLVFGAAMLMARVVPRAAALLFVVGGVLFNLPPGPVPMIVLCTGGVLWSVAVIWLGVTFCAQSPTRLPRSS
jgi:hypothetical protein